MSVREAPSTHAMAHSSNPFGKQLCSLLIWAMKKPILLFAFITLCYSLCAQRIQGIISDAGTRQPLANATVSLLLATDSSLVKGALAGDDGSYHFEKLHPGNYLLLVQMMGFSRQFVPVAVTSTELTLDVRLTAEVKQLGEVTVKASRPLIERRADKVIFNVENSIVASGNDALELLKMTPTVSVSSGNGIRLKGKENVLVMLDGKMVPAETLADVLQSLSAEQISKIELVYTPSAAADASASGGIINILTKKGMGRGFNGIANVSALESRYGKYNGGASFNWRTTKINLYGTINSRADKGYKNELIIRELDAGNGLSQALLTPTEVFTNVKTVSGKAGIDYTLPRGSTMGFSADGIFSSSNNRVLAMSSFMNEAGGIDSSLVSKSQPARNNNYSSYDLYFKNKPNAKGQLTLNVNQTHFNGITHQTVNTTIYTDYPIPNGYALSYNSTRAIIDITMAQAGYTMALKHGLSLDVGFKELFTQSKNRSTSEQVNPLPQEPAIQATGYKENIVAGYLLMSRQSKLVRIQAGLRAEHSHSRLNGTGSNSDYLDLFPSAMVSKKISDRYQVSLNYTSRIQRPSYKALIPFVVPIDRYTQEKGNPDLQPAYSNSIELVNTIGKLIFSLGYMHTRDVITDFIEQDPQTRVWTITKGNFSRKENFDATLVLPVNMARWWSTNNTLQGFYNSFTDKTGKVGGVNYDQGQYSCSINSINTFLLPQNIKAELTASYNSAYIDGFYHVSHSSTINLGLSKTFFEKKLNLKVAVNDLFHGSGYSFHSNSGNLHLSGRSYTDSRQFVLALSCKFGKTAMQSSRLPNDDTKGRLNL
jgi:outer membrane cobalamin receptor